MRDTAPTENAKGRRASSTRETITPMFSCFSFQLMMRGTVVGMREDSGMTSWHSQQLTHSRQQQAEKSLLALNLKLSRKLQAT